MNNRLLQIINKLPLSNKDRNDLINCIIDYGGTGGGGSSSGTTTDDNSIVLFNPSLEYEKQNAKVINAWKSTPNKLKKVVVIDKGNYGRPYSIYKTTQAISFDDFTRKEIILLSDAEVTENETAQYKATLIYKDEGVNPGFELTVEVASYFDKNTITADKNGNNTLTSTADNNFGNSKDCVATGGENEIDGISCNVIGIKNKVNNYSSVNTVIGNENVLSSVMGLTVIGSKNNINQNTNLIDPYTVVLGQYAYPVPNAVLIIGCGTSSDPCNALVITKDHLVHVLACGYSGKEVNGGSSSLMSCISNAANDIDDTALGDA